MKGQYKLKTSGGTKTFPFDNKPNSYIPAFDKMLDWIEKHCDEEVTITFVKKEGDFGYETTYVYELDKKLETC